MSRSRLNEDVGVLLANKCCVFAAAGAALGTAAAIGLGATAGGVLATMGGIAGGALLAGAAGAALGAGTSAIMGGDVGQGALYGGLGGALTGGVGAAFGGAGGAAGAAAQTAKTGGAGFFDTVGAGFKAGTGNLAAQGVLNAAPQATDVGGITVGKTGIVAGNPLGITTAAPQTSFSQGISGIGNWIKTNPAQAIQGAALVGQGLNAMTPISTAPLGPQQKGMAPSNIHLSPNYQRSTPLAYYAEGGITDVGTPGMFPQSQATPNRYAAPTQLPAQALHLQRTINDNFDPRTRTFTGKGFADGGPINKYYLAGLQNAQAAAQQQQQATPQQAVPVQPQTPPQPLAAPVQQAGLGAVQPSYARGRFVSGEGSGISDSVPALIDGKQPARIASGEYIIPSRAVSELGSGSSDAGAKELDKMVQRIQQTRKKTIGKGKIAVDAKARKVMPV